MGRKREEKSQKFRPVSCRWPAVETVAIHMAVGSQTISPGPATAQQSPFSSNRSGLPIPTVQFPIAPGPFELLLPALENATELHIVCPIR
jgi:hypothetical protein